MTSATIFTRPGQPSRNGLMEFNQSPTAFTMPSKSESPDPPNKPLKAAITALMVSTIAL